MCQDVAMFILQAIPVVYFFFWVWFIIFLFVLQTCALLCGFWSNFNTVDGYVKYQGIALFFPLHCHRLLES